LAGTSRKRLFQVSAVVAVIVLGAALVSNRDHLAIWMAPGKQAVATRTRAATEADRIFWQVFHGGDYDRIEPTLAVLTAAYLESPTDAVTAAHIAWLHNWRSAERRRMDSVSATITDDILLARRYFQEAVAVNPQDPRTRGFLAGHLLAEGSLHQDEKLTRRGYFLMLDAIAAWPEFNLFTAGYVMSRLPHDSPRFQEGLEWEWDNLAQCTGEEINRADPDYAPYMRLEIREGVKRACWNSRIAPHNLEGFWLNMGDMLVKAGDWQTAQKIYANARLAREYPDWKYQAVLDDRIRQAEANVARFRSGETPVMINSEFACMACHLD
jgi:hypothetical protein